MSEQTLSNLSNSKIKSNFDIKDIKINKSVDKLKELKEVTNKFESIFINQILKQARNSKLAKGIFDSDAEKTFNSMIDQKYSEILCPHSAVGVFVGRKQSDADVPMVTLATAHPAKFPKAVEKATSIYPKLPSRMADLFDLKERITIVENNLQSIESVVRERIQT